MTVMILERVTPSLRGELSRWLIEVATGTFVGRVSGLVRDLLWERCTRRADDGTVLQIWRTNSEQGFDMRSHNPRERVPVEMEGIWLVQTMRGTDQLVEVSETVWQKRRRVIDIPPPPEGDE
ncbi:MAG: cas1 [Chlorobi bacterium]|jgi:CRISPR-associated protein Cas2|nr:cas1 [Chlorobiota bacterium]